jgi:hypothetical protein
MGLLIRSFKKVPEASRARNRRAQAYSFQHVERGDSSTTKHMGFFQRTAK